MFHSLSCTCRLVISSLDPHKNPVMGKAEVAHLSLGSPEAHCETGSQMQAVYLGSDPGSSGRAVGKGTEKGEATGARSWYSDHLPALPRPESFLGRGTLDDKTETLLDKPGWLVSLVREQSSPVSSWPLSAGALGQMLQSWPLSWPPQGVRELGCLSSVTQGHMKSGSWAQLPGTCTLSSRGCWQTQPSGRTTRVAQEGIINVKGALGRGHPSFLLLHGLH